MIAKQLLSQRIRVKFGPKLDIDTNDGGYDCCGCASPSNLLDDIVKYLERVEKRGGAV